MKMLNTVAINQVSAGLCSEFYEATVPLDYLPIVAKHLKLLNQHQFDAEVMLQELRAAGLDTSLEFVSAGVYCEPAAMSAYR